MIKKSKLLMKHNLGYFLKDFYQKKTIYTKCHKEFVLNWAKHIFNVLALEDWDVIAIEISHAKKILQNEKFLKLYQKNMAMNNKYLFHVEIYCALRYGIGYDKYKNAFYANCNMANDKSLYNFLYDIIMAFIKNDNQKITLIIDNIKQSFLNRKKGKTKEFLTKEVWKKLKQEPSLNETIEKENLLWLKKQTEDENLYLLLQKIKEL